MISETIFLILFVLGLCVRQFVARNNPSGIEAISVTLVRADVCAVVAETFIQKINFFPNVDGHYYLLYFVLSITKFSDTGAYSVGSLIGKHKMIPRISPGKTWEGFGGAVILVSTGASVLFVHIAHNKMPAAMGTLGCQSFLASCSVSAAVIGDLIESLFKRESRREGLRTDLSGHRRHTGLA